MRTKLKATIKADETMVRLAKEACEVQDACNLCGVAQAFARAMKELFHHPQSTGGSWTNQNPITLAWVDKLCHLSGYTQEYGSDIHGKVMDLAEGKDIEFEYEEMYLTSVLIHEEVAANLLRG